MESSWTGGENVTPPEAKRVVSLSALWHMSLQIQSYEYLWSNLEMEITGSANGDVTSKLKDEHHYSCNH